MNIYIAVKYIQEISTLLFRTFRNNYQQCPIPVEKIYWGQEKSDSVVVSTSTLCDRVLSSRPALSMGMSGVKTWLSALEAVYHDSDDHVNVGPVSFNWGHKRTIEDDMHPGIDHPQCQGACRPGCFMSPIYWH